MWRIKAGAEAIETELAGVHDVLAPDEAGTVTCFAGSECAAFDAMAGAGLGLTCTFRNACHRNRCCWTCACHSQTACGNTSSFRIAGDSDGQVHLLRFDGADAFLTWIAILRPGQHTGIVLAMHCL